MSTLESTVSMLEILPESDVQIVYNITKDLLEQRKSSVFKPVTKEQVMQDLETSTKQIEEGKYRSADEVIGRLREKYGL